MLPLDYLNRPNQVIMVATRGYRGALKTLCFYSSAGRVCPSVDPYVLLVPGGPLLHRLVCAVPALYGCDCRTTQDTYNHGIELDDHCGASSYF